MTREGTLLVFSYMHVTGLWKSEGDGLAGKVPLTKLFQYQNFSPNRRHNTWQSVLLFCIVIFPFATEKALIDIFFIFCFSFLGAIYFCRSVWV